MTQITGASSTERPFFRYDLQTTAIEEGGNRYVDVTAPNGGESFRFFEVEYAVACGMDGERDVPGIVRWAMLELDLQTTPAEVSAIVAKLAELNYIEGVEAAPAKAAATVEAAAPVPASADDDSDIELGTSGKAAAFSPRPARPSDAADLELGMAGRSDDTEIEEESPSSIDSEFELGVAGNEGVAPVDEVVADLAAPEKAAPAKVKPAVQEAAKVAAKVISREEVSEEVVAAVAEAEEATPELVAKSSDISDSIAEEAEPAVEAGKEAIAIADSPENDAKRAAVEAQAKERARKRAARKPIIQRSASLVLWLILLGAVAGAAYYYFFHTPYVLEHPADQPLGRSLPLSTSANTGSETQAELAAPSTMALSEIPTAEALAVAAGTVEWVSDPGSEVSAGDVILKMRGSERLQAAVDKEKTALETYQLRLETAEQRGEEDEAKLAVIQADIARKQADLDAASAKLAPFVVTAPIDGVVEVLVKALDKVAKGQAIGKVTGVSKAIAIFSLSDESFVAEGEEYMVVAIDDAELKTTCIVTKAEEKEVTLECPVDSGIEAGAAVRLLAAAGDDETGDDETGDDETGDDESGDDESGDDESGDDETGDDETGDDETGDE